MSTLMGNIQTCQYTATIANASGELQNVLSAEDTRRSVKVTPVKEGQREVYTAVALSAGQAVGSASAAASATTAVNEAAPVVEVVQENATQSPLIYGALATVATGTQRCGVLTSGVVVFRGVAADNVSGSVASTEVGFGIIGPEVNTVTAGNNNGGIDASSGADVGVGKILAVSGKYVLVNLDK